MDQQPQQNGAFRNLGTTAAIGLRCARYLSLLPVMCLRTGVGDRFVSASSVFFGYLAIRVIAFLYPSPIYGYLIPSFFLLCATHRFSTYVSNQQGQPVHGHFTGRTWPLWEKIGFTAFTAPFADAGAWIFLSMLLRPIDSGLATYMLLSGAALALHETWLFYHYRKLQKDTRDHKIEAQVTTHLMQDKPASQFQDAPVVQVARRDP